MNSILYYLFFTPLIIIILFYLLIVIGNRLNIHWTKFCRAHPRLVKDLNKVLLLLFVLFLGLQIRDVYYVKSNNIFWHMVVKKNHKPFDVALTEFETKNREGYCWRDRRYYSKEELWFKAMKSLVTRMLYENQFFMQYEPLDAGDDPLPAGEYCRRENGCFVTIFSKNLDEQKLIRNRLVNKNNLELQKKPFIDNDVVRIFKSATDKNFINEDFKLDNYTIYHTSIFSRSSVYDSENCCHILNKSEWFLLKNKYTLKEYEEFNEAFGQETVIPDNIDINSWGIGNFYFAVTASRPRDDHSFTDHENNLLKSPERVYLMNNCGDILYMPYYSPKSLKKGKFEFVK